MTDNNDFKLGLALSGGGFRSALFHVGMLARLAELDLLRKVDVISSVSGGSIIAAYYYLKVNFSPFVYLRLSFPCEFCALPVVFAFISL